MNVFNLFQLKQWYQSHNLKQCLYFCSMIFFLTKNIDSSAFNYMLFEK